MPKDATAAIHESFNIHLPLSIYVSQFMGHFHFPKALHTSACSKWSHNYTIIRIGEPKISIIYYAWEHVLFPLTCLHQSVWICFPLQVDRTKTLNLNSSTLEL